MDRDLVFMDSVMLQQDMRIRLPKALLVNIEGVPGKSYLGVYFNALTKEIVLKIDNNNKDSNAEVE